MDLRIDAYRIWFLPIESNKYPYDLIMIVAVLYRTVTWWPNLPQTILLRIFHEYASVTEKENNDEKVLILPSALMKMKVHWFAR